MKRHFQKTLVRLSAAMLLFASAVGANTKTTLYNFGDIPGDDGFYPVGDLATDGASLFGVTGSGGSDRSGIVYSIGMNGSGYTVLHSFGATNSEGSSPSGGVLVNGGVIYGTTDDGGTSGGGVVYKMNTAGTGYVELYQFGSVFRPVGSLTLVGNTLYGMAAQGGANNKGALYKVNTDGSGFAVLHDFGASANDGDFATGPVEYGCGLVHDGSTLYGMTTSGGGGGLPGGVGTVFKVNTDGSGYAVLHKFGSTSNDGQHPSGKLALIGTSLYGSTDNGGTGSYRAGITFSITTDGTNFRTLHNFRTGSSDGLRPWQTLVASGSALYGVSYAGGNSGQYEVGHFTIVGKGTVYKINPDGSSYRVLYHFGTGEDECYQPNGGLVVVGSQIYGTSDGGANSVKDGFQYYKRGAIYKLALDAVSQGAFDSRAGQFAGMLGNNAGTLSITLDGAGRFTGKIFLGPTAYSIKGTFDENGDYTGTVGKTATPLTLHFDLAAAADDPLTGTIGATALAATHAAYGKSDTISELGKYTVLLAATDPAATIPQGTSYGTLTVGKAGASTLVGKLSDGTPFSTSGTLLTNANRHQLIVTQPKLYRGKGHLLGTLTFQPIPGSDCDGALHWLKPAQPKSAYYQAGFDTTLNLAGARYAKPLVHQPALSFSDGTLTLGDALIQEPITISSENVATITSANTHKIKLKLSAKSGSFKGTFLHPTSNKTTKFSGVLFQNATSPQAGGYLLGPIASENVAITPAP